MNDQETYDKLTRILYDSIHNAATGFWEACDGKFDANMVISATNTATAFSYILLPTVENKRKSRESIHKFIDRLLDCNGWRDDACAIASSS